MTTSIKTAFPVENDNMGDQITCVPAAAVVTVIGDSKITADFFCLVFLLGLRITDLLSKDESGCWSLRSLDTADYMTRRRTAGRWLGEGLT